MHLGTLSCWGKLLLLGSAIAMEEVCACSAAMFGRVVQKVLEQHLHECQDFRFSSRTFTGL